MHSLTPAHWVSISFTLAIIIAVSFYAGKKVKTAQDFAVGGKKAGVGLVIGTIIGTIIGGGATIGTAQLAFSYGLSAWWFTLGAGIGSMALAFLARPLRESGENTIPGLLSKSYGEAAGFLASIFSSLGIFLNIVAQTLAATALITAMTSIPPLIAATVSSLLMIGYVLIGGVWGSGLVGIAKMILMFFSLIVVGITAYLKAGGLVGIQQSFPNYPWFSLFGQGYSIDLAAGFSSLVGMLSTQTYLQAIFSGKTDKISKRGAMLSALIIPPAGIAGILVGLYMRANFPHIDAAQAFPLFVIKSLSPWVGGIVLGTLLIGIVGSGAGLILGVSTMLSNDIYLKFINPHAKDRQLLWVSRLTIITLAGLALFFVTGNMNSLILKWNFFSMGLRGSAVLLPLLGTIFFKGKIPSRVILLAITAGPLATVLWKLYGIKSLDPLYIGMGVNFLIMAAGFFALRFNTEIAKKIVV